jgi:hypothetical protein
MFVIGTLASSKGTDVTTLTVLGAVLTSSTTLSSVLDLMPGMLGEANNATKMQIFEMTKRIVKLLHTVLSAEMSKQMEEGFLESYAKLLFASLVLAGALITADPGKLLLIYI